MITLLFILAIVGAPCFVLGWYSANAYNRLKGKYNED